MVVIFGLEQLMRRKGREYKTVGEATNGGHEFDSGGTHNQHPLKQSGKALFNS